MTVSQQDHFELAQLAAQYCDGVIRKDVDTWSATWADDATWQLRGDPIVGKEAIVAYWLEAMERFEWVVQTAPHSVFDVVEGATTGTGRVIAQETFKRADGVMGGLIAVYHDEYVKTSDGWKYASRALEIKHFE
ncbi:MAG: nuclear transport factor 2 family protein [Ilumatobacter sp.]|jgi:ketosteroid isomerase-like protein|uniref:nuclear transport factor 2 family protein n=1 Tax=Ilumatobacter sp. TaxID=1967498 RepID=UPI00391DF84E